MGTTPPMPTDDQFAKFGKYVAATMGSATEWSGADMLEEIAAMATAVLGVPVGDQDENDLKFWRDLGADLGIEYRL